MDIENKASDIPLRSQKGLTSVQSTNVITVTRPWQNTHYLEYLRLFPVGIVFVYSGCLVWIFRETL